MKMTLKITVLAFLAIPLVSLQAQLTQFQIGSQAVTNPGAGLNPNVWPASGGESPGNAIDGTSGLKYLNFGELNTGYLLTYTSPVTANGINFFTANDSEARDPATFSLYGSTTVVASTTPGTLFSLSNFTLIVNSQALALPSIRLTAASISFLNSTAYTTYLLVFPTVKDSAAANSMQIGDALLTTGGAPIATAGSTIAGGQLVPEPGSACLLSLAGASVWGLRRRR